MGLMYKVGDVVHIRDDLSLYKRYDVAIIGAMSRHKGEWAMIRSSSEEGLMSDYFWHEGYRLNFDENDDAYGAIWTDDMFDCPREEEEEIAAEEIDTLYDWMVTT